MSVKKTAQPIEKLVKPAPDWYQGGIVARPGTYREGDSSTQGQNGGNKPGSQSSTQPREK